jgi:hypothetical protein
MRRIRIAPIAALALGAVAVLPITAAAAEITVWEHEDFRGASTVIDGPTARLDSGWNDRISSFRVDSGSWELCRDWDYRNCRIVGPGTDEASRMEMGWNDAISSLRPVSAASAGAGNVETVAQRLYSGLLGRDADPEGLRNAAAQIRAGKLDDLVANMTQSQEFRSISQRLSPSDLLDQIYRGLLGRGADTAARTAYLPRLQRGDVSNVVLDIVNSEEFDGGSTVSRGGSTPSNITQDEVRANGTGVVIWGGKKYFESVTAARVQLASNGRIHISFNGSSPQTLDGTYTRESHDFIRVNTIDWPQRGVIDVDGGVQLDHNQLARVDVASGAQGTRDRVVFTFVAEDYQIPREESLCQEEIQARLESQGHSGKKLAFLPASRSRVAGNRYRLTGEVVILAENTSAEYRCEVDASGKRLLDASVVASE